MSYRMLMTLKGRIARESESSKLKKPRFYQDHQDNKHKTRSKLISSTIFYPFLKPKRLRGR